MRKIIIRKISLDVPKNKSVFLWGPRKVGKSYYLRHHFTKEPFIDLLKTDVCMEYLSRPFLLRERYKNHQGLIIIDEIQKAPPLLNEIHWLIENTKCSFLMTGSSAHKLKREKANMLGGRAWKRLMLPLSYSEVAGFDLEKCMQSGLLPPHFLSENPVEDLRAYVSDYLKEEIIAEALIENIPAFAEFLRIAAITGSELLNYANVARESGVTARVVRRYFEILESTYLGFRLQPWTRARSRRLIETEKFYLFDVGVSNYLSKRNPVIGSADFGKSFEHFILMELKAYQAYREPEMELKFWRSASGYEVDFIFGEMDLAIEVKSSSRVHETDCRSLMALKEDARVKRMIIVCLEKQYRELSNGVQVWPWKDFLDALWSGAEFFK